jgi:hypothetical protein
MMTERKKMSGSKGLNWLLYDLVCHFTRSVPHSLHTYWLRKKNDFYQGGTNWFRDFVISSDFRWFQVISGDFKWFQVISGDFRWFQMISNDFRWFQVISDDFRWFQVISSDFKWFQMISSDFKWFSLEDISSYESTAHH